MRVKIFIIAVLSIISLLLTACSSEKNEKGAKATSGNDKDKQEQVQDSVEVFGLTLQTTIEGSNKLLDTFNKNLDGLYTAEVSDQQFANVLKGVVDESNKLVAGMEKVYVDGTLYDFRQTTVAYLNRQHELFLNAVDMANQEMLNKEYLRTEYLAVKEEQAGIVNTWLNGE